MSNDIYQRGLPVEGVFHMMFIDALGCTVPLTNFVVPSHFVFNPVFEGGGQVAKCDYCALGYGEVSCQDTDCTNSVLLSEERYTLAKLLGIENLEPSK